MGTERDLYEIASTQRGLVTLDQIRAAGVTPRRLNTSVNHGRLARVHGGVYRMGSVASDFHTAALAALLGAGEGALVSHETAAALHGILPGAEGPIEITVPWGRRPRLHGVRLHSTRRLAEADLDVVDGLAVTSPARTIIDLSARLSPEVLTAMVDEARRRCLVSPPWVAKQLERLPLAPGRAPVKLAKVLADRADVGAAQESELERRVWRVIREAGLPLPVAQHVVDCPIGPRRLDLAWPERMAGAECDGFAWHRTRAMFDDDRLRRNELTALGWTLAHLTHAMSDDQIVFGLNGALSAPKRRNRN